MVRVEGSIVIEKPLDDVFDFVADESNEPRYNPRMIRAEKVTPGPIGASTRFNSVMMGAGPAAAMEIEFTEFERPRHIAENVRLSNMDIHGELEFAPVPEGTRMSWTWDLQPHGLLVLLGPLVRHLGDRQEREVWAGLKQHLERQTPPATETMTASAP